MKVHFGVLDTVDFLLQHFPGHRSADGEEEEEEDDEAHSSDTWTQRDISPFIVAGMCDSLGQRVRSSAVKLALTVYTTFGLDSMAPMLAGLRPAKQQLLKQTFEESEWDEHDHAEAAKAAAAGRPVTGKIDCGKRNGKHDAAIRVKGLGRPVTGLIGRPVTGLTGRPVTGGPKMPRAAQAKTEVRSMEELMHEAELDEEELFMDHILEDVGMVFGGDDSCSQGYAMLPGMLDPLFSLEELEEQCYLEQQLRALGIDLDFATPPGSSRGPGAMAPLPGLGGSLPGRIDEAADDDIALLSFRSHGRGEVGKAGPVAGMQARSMAVF